MPEEQRTYLKCKNCGCDDFRAIVSTTMSFNLYHEKVGDHTYLEHEVADDIALGDSDVDNDYGYVCSECGEEYEE